MSDRELLEKAAKAAGYWDKDFDCYKGPISWDPIEKDEDALRLMVKLGIDVTFDDIEVYAFPPDGIGGLCEMVKENNDPYAATRRAIVKAAAEIGKEMKNAA